MAKTFGYKCPSCKTPLEIPIELLGKRGGCASCGNAFDLPHTIPRTPLHRIELGYNIGAMFNIGAVLGVWFLVTYLGKQDARNRFILDDTPENTRLLYHIWDCVSAIEWFAAGILVALIYGISRLGYLVTLIEDIRGRD